MTKDVEQQFYDEVSKAIHAQDSGTLSTLIEFDETKKETETDPKQEDPVADQGQEGLEKPVETSEPSDEPRSTDSAESDNDEDTVESLKRQLEEARNVDHRLKSDAGRVPGLQRKLAELDKKLQEMAEKSAATNENGDDASGDAIDNEHLAIIRETDPTLAAAIEKSISSALKSAKRSSVDAARVVTETFRQEEEEASLRHEWNVLVQEAPEAPEIFRSKEWDEWKQNITPSMRLLAESAVADDVLIAIDRFNKATGRHQVVTSSPVQEARDRKLKTRTPGSEGPSSPSGNFTDPEAYFNKLYKDLLPKPAGSR
jgi:hypothetical protein